jgi:DNA mismatch endonuclease, patch repair protein
MVDKISPDRRSANMARIRSKDMEPEMVVRRLAHSLGYRFRLHHTGLPGKPDLVFPSRKVVIFVHGCFWHQHNNADCLDARLPQSNQNYWLPKLARNVARDAQNVTKLEQNGWRSLVIWECETKNGQQLASKLSRFLR